MFYDAAWVCAALCVSAVGAVELLTSGLVEVAANDGRVMVLDLLGQYVVNVGSQFECRVFSSEPVDVCRHVYARYE